MKLISCYIANFGGLSDYSLRFDAGLTVLMEPNGFGKTTLAEFIRAMFYGFPRANKALEKNRRKKYLPWQGGRYGGNLVFEHEGVQYRIERTFGEKPASDTFALYDLRTNQKTAKFSEEIGLELFQLDADSFERSTYLPQLHADLASLSTDSIQAKLGDLVEDTNDVNNFEAAKTALQRKRSALIPYRGPGGAVAQAQAQVSELDGRISGARGKTGELDDRRAEHLAAKEALRRKNGALDNIREKIRLASQAAGRKAVADGYEQLRLAFQRDCEREDQLSAQYPNGFPAPEETAGAIRATEDAAALQVRLEPSPDYQAARARLASLPQFAAGVPSEEELLHCQGLCGSYAEARTQLQNARLSDRDAAALAELERFFSPGVPDEAAISQCLEARRNLAVAKAALAGAVLTPEESAQLAPLRELFRAGVPSDGELEACRQQLDAAQRLRAENQRITAEAAAVIAREAPARRRSAFLPVLVLGVLSVVCGGVLLGLRSYLAGGCLAGFGLLLLIAAVYLRLKDMVSRAVSESRQAGPAISDRDKERLRKNDGEIRRLEQAVAAFTGRYTDAAGSPGDSLRDLEDKVREFRRLSGRESEVQALRRTLEEEAASETRRLAQRLSPYYGESIPEDAEADLTAKRRQYEELLGRREAAAQASREWSGRLDALGAEISGFLKPYAGEVRPEDFASRLHSLQLCRNDYIRDRDLVAGQDEQRRKNEAALRQYQLSLSAFSRKYGLAPDLTRDDLQAVLSDAEEYRALHSTRGEKQARLDAYCRENEALLTAPEPEEHYDMDGLNAAEGQLTEEIRSLSGEITRLEHEIGRLQEQVDQIPAWEDEQAAWMARYEEGRKNAGLLDAAISYLEQARESLSTSYLSPIRQAFTGYLRRLTGEDGEGVYIEPSLDVSMDRSGKARELGYFSTGQTDAVTLCMRLALVDALFKDTRPFLVLDDPFVNLDDARTLAAIRLLKELARDRQIIYLVCNSSRGA